LPTDDLESSIKALRPFVPAKDFEKSKRFYADLGFKVEPLGPDLAAVSFGAHSFLLQNYFVGQWAENFMMHMLVSDLRPWWKHIAALDLAARYAVPDPKPPRLESWGLNVAYVIDPSGVLWHFAERPSSS
jgi:catechol 2,3-dioxygenase-like lactoylglutathione lyase family enzyme